MQIYKMHGTGNDFILLPNLEEAPYDYSSLAKAWCRHHYGIGADGILVLLPSKVAEFRMRIFNADGSEAEMCGNGIRCFARHVYEKKLINKPKFRVETLAGIVEPECQVAGGQVVKVRVDMGVPRYGDLHAKRGQLLKLNTSDNLLMKLELPDGIVEGATISMGNPHYVIFQEEESPRWRCGLHGKSLSVHKAHPHQSNVEFALVVSPGAMKVSVWERGVGPTLACGSGACASVVAGRIAKGLDEKVKVEMPGGFLEVEWKGEGSVFLSGPALYVFEGEVSKELLNPLSLRSV